MVHFVSGGGLGPGESVRPIWRIAVLQLGDDFGREGAAAGDFGEVFGHLAEGVGRAVGEEEDGGSRGGVRHVDHRIWCILRVAVPPVSHDLRLQKNKIVTRR